MLCQSVCREHEAEYGGEHEAEHRGNESAPDSAALLVGRSKTQGIALSLGDKLILKQKG